jgi:hypothetical protein
MLGKLSSALTTRDLSSSAQLHGSMELGWGEMDWIGLAQDRRKWRALLNSVLNLRVA